MSWDKAASPSVIDQKPSRRNAFMACQMSIRLMGGVNLVDR